MLTMNHLIGFGAAPPPIVWTTVWTGTPTAVNTGFEGYALRTKPSASLSAGGIWVRVTITPPASGGNITVDHASVGVASTFPSMSTNPPKELLFSGASGFDKASGGAAFVSDPVALTFLSSDILIIDFDMHSTGGNFGYFVSTGALQYKAASADYATAAVSGYSSSNQCAAISKIEAGN